MGISLDLWRARVGNFGQLLANVKASVPARCVRRSHRLLCVLAYLLLIGCVELNPGPGPTVADLSRRMDDFFAELRNAHTALLMKIDNSVVDLSSKLMAK